MITLIKNPWILIINGLWDRKLLLKLDSAYMVNQLRSTGYDSNKTLLNETDVSHTNCEHICKNILF